MKAFAKCGFMLCCLLFSCSLEERYGDIEGESGFSYKESKEAWLELKEINGDSYHYTILFLSWTGFGNRTIITVVEGEVNERYYEAFERREENGGQIEEITESYHEMSEDLGTHEEGAEPLTIDELYQICIARYLSVDEQSNSIYFNTNDAGVITTCGYVPKNCADDCFRGFDMLEFEWD